MDKLNIRFKQIDAYPEYGLIFAIKHDTSMTLFIYTYNLRCIVEPLISYDSFTKYSVKIKKTQKIISTSECSDLILHRRGSHLISFFPPARFDTHRIYYNLVDVLDNWKTDEQDIMSSLNKIYKKQKSDNRKVIFNKNIIANYYKYASSICLLVTQFHCLPLELMHIIIAHIYVESYYYVH